MTARRVRSALVVVSVLLCLATVLVAQNSRARIVRLSYIDGDARIDQVSGQGEQRAILNMPVVEGTRLTAEDGSRVEVEFENGSTIRLVGPAEVVFRELSMRNSGDKVSLVEVRNGLVYFNVIRKGDDDFRIALGDHSFSFRKSSHLRADVTADGQKVTVFNGGLELLDAPNAVTVKKGETVSFDTSDAARYDLAKGYDPLGADVWDHDRQQDSETYARSQAYKNSLTYAGSPYSYGLSDLAYYGSWFNGPGGNCWRPSGYGMGWDPFAQNGAWTYYPSSGWVYVSYYPWGWTPYRYGSWNFVGNTGWCWSPGGYYGGWNPIPVVVMAPPAYVRPSPPHKPGGPPVFIGERKVLPGGRLNPNPDGAPVRGVSPGRSAGAGGVTPMSKPASPGGLERGNHGRETPVPVSPRNPSPSPSQTPSPSQGPKSEPRVTPPAPMPHVDPTPRMDRTPAPAPMPRMDRMPAPAPAPRVETPKSVPHSMGFAPSRGAIRTGSMGTGHMSSQTGHSH
jgi:hypothetical protein